MTSITPTCIAATVRHRLDNKAQVYIVYPLIQESEKLDLKNLEDGYNAMCEVFPDNTLSCFLSIASNSILDICKDRR